MKIVVINSSYRKNGNTSTILSLLTHSIKKQNQHTKITTVCIAHRNIKRCRGCRICFDKGEENCPLKDELLAIRKQIKEADCIIAASPVYVEDVNAAMKNWIDRMAFISHRPELAGKRVYALSTSAVGSTAHTLRTMSTAFRTWGAFPIGKSTFITGARMSDSVMNLHYSKRIKKIAKIIISKTKKNITPTFFALLVFKVQQIYYQRQSPEDKQSLDYQYWKKKKWVTPDKTFYIPHRANPLRVILARIIASGIARFVLK